MDILQTVKDLQEAHAMLWMIQNDPQTICEQYWVEKEDLILVEAELNDRINALEDKDIKWFCEVKLTQVNDSNSRIEWIKSEISRLQNLLEREEKRLEKAKASIDWIMKATWTEKLETALNNLSYRKSESVAIKNSELIPEEYWREKIEKSVDKTAIKNAIKNWIEVAWATIEVKQNLQIK